MSNEERTAQMPERSIGRVGKLEYEIYDGPLRKADLRRIVFHLLTMCEDFDPTNAEEFARVAVPLPVDTRRAVQLPLPDLIIALGGGGTEETHLGRFWGLFNVGGDGDPLALFPEKAEAERYLKARQAADPEGDDYLSQDWTVLRVDAVLSVLNTVDPDPFPELAWPPRFAIRSVDELRTLQRTKPVAPAGGAHG